MTDSPHHAGYRNSALSTDERVRDLISRMTLEEKVGQLRQILSTGLYEKGLGRATLTPAFEQAMAQHVGAIYGVLRADPWMKRTVETGLSPREAAELVNAMQRVALERTRLGIPLLISEECPHGLMAVGATVFPSPIGLASTWNLGLIGRMASAIARELRSEGANVGYGPILDLARDPRWSRVEETFGEDPHLAAQMGAAMVRAFQERGLANEEASFCTLKHFAAYGESLGGHNGGSVNVGRRELAATLLPAFRACVSAGAGSVMTSYNEIDGVPCSADEELLTGVLRGRWGFDGFVVSDLFAIDGLKEQRVASDFSEAAALALKAGLDLDLGANAFGPPLLEALRRGRVTIDEIDRAAARVLAAKFRLGLFENAYARPERAAEIVGCRAHRDLSLEVSRQSIVLLANNGLLPLSRGLNAIAVVGPNAHSMYNQLGDYTAPQRPEDVTTVFDGIRAKLPPGASLHYARGGGIRDTSKEGFREALEAARKSEVVVAVVGSSSSRYGGVGFAETGASDAGKTSTAVDMDCGEGFDRSSLEPGGVQLELLRELAATGVPLVVVLITGRPLLLGWIVEHAAAVVNAWYPGPQGGVAIADVLFGDVNPSGRLPVAFPKSAGHLPVYYNYRPYRGKYVEGDSKPLFPFGFGLSYTQFEYTNVRVHTGSTHASLPVVVSVDVANTGGRAGEEGVQLYVTDEVASVVTPVKSLKAFQRVRLEAGEKRTVRFELADEHLAICGKDLSFAVEPGVFRVTVGPDSERGLEAKFELRGSGPYGT